MRFIKLFGLLFFITTTVFSQKMTTKFNYEAKWNSVEANFKKGLNETAEKEIKTILLTAKAEKKDEQIIKAICNYRVSLHDRDEKARYHDIQFFENELKESVFPVTQLLHSMLGDLYWTYYQENRWQILDRTSISHDQKSETTNIDPETWSADQFYETAHTHFIQSLNESNLSQRYSMSQLNEIIDKGENTEKLRPTLYDFLVHHAIDFFAQEENEITKPTNVFEINDEASFSPASSFINANFITSDTTSRKFLVLGLYQQALKFHLNDEDPSALIDADIARILYVKSHSILSTKNESYLKALEQIATKYPSNAQAAMAMYYKAETFIRYTQTNPKRGYVNAIPDESKINYKGAKKICDAIVEKFPASEAAWKSQILLQQILTQTLNITTEKVVVPNQPSIALVKYRNIQSIYCKIVKLSTNEYKDLVYDYNNDYKKINTKSAFKSWSLLLPERNDYKNHSTEIKLDALPIGTYAIIISESNEFQKNSYTSLSFLNVSNLAYISESENSGKGTSLYVLNRTTGEPLSNVNVKTWTNTYDYTSRKYIQKEGQKFMSDKNGFLKLKSVNGQSGFGIELIKGDDDLFLNDQLYINEYSQAEKVDDLVRTFFFTDRSMYRPGQLIHFKGIVVTSKGREHKQHEVLKSHTTTVRLMDVNYQLVKELEFTTNEYGSFSGSFAAPEGLLTGQFHIEGENGNAFFNIEEYKRPKFEVVFDTLKSSYKLMDQIHLKGHAKAFAGNNIDGAKVSYRVVREARFPYYWCFYRWGQPASASLEIAHGVSVTKADGSFDISFEAIPDESIDRNSMPVFDYNIDVDVTDLNGETRSGTSNLSVSYQSLLLKIDMPEQVDKNELSSIQLHSTNLGGTNIPSQVNLTCKKLKSPDKTYRTRLWPQPEINSINEHDFRNYFPLDEYNNENDYQQWKEEKILWSKQFTTSEEGNVILAKTNYDEGWYVFEAKATDKNGEAVMDKKYVRISNNSDPIPLPNEHLLVTKINVNPQPSEIAKIGIASADQDLHILYHDTKSNLKSQWLQFNGNKFFTFPITENDRGGFYINVMFVKNNRIYKTQQWINVPFTNKELKVTLETFRDKMLPGSEQEWKLNITGSKKEKVSAELLATMYDASLDAFKPHVFNPFSLYTNNVRAIEWNSLSNFSTEQGRQIYYKDFHLVNQYNKVYDQFEWWGLDHVDRYGNQFRYQKRKRSRNEPLWWMNPMDFGYNDMKAARAGFMMDVSADEAAPMAAMAKSVTMNEELSLRHVVIQSRESQQNGAEKIPANNVTLRTNFAETAFFFPDLHTDEEGNIVLKFNAPDALTRWKLMAFAHTQTLQSGMMTETSVTQKELMIIPNTPRFFREGDKMVYSAKITNLSGANLSGEAIMKLNDALNDQSIDVSFKNEKASIPFSVKAGESVSVQWNIEIPRGFTDPVTVKTIAVGRKSNFQDVREEFSDGEQNVVPVLLNSMLVTETLPMSVRTNSTKNFSFEKLLHSNRSSTLRHYNLTLEYTGNPAWYAVQSLPYLTDYPYECAEQTFNRYYANVLASHIANSNPKIKEVFGKWEQNSAVNNGSKEEKNEALLSNLQKNQELKSALLQETPWVLEAKNEEEQKRNIALLFDMNRMSAELDRTARELELMQTPNGGFTWFKGMPDDPYMTQYIITGIGRLMHLNVTEVQDTRIMTMVEKALPYLDARMKEDYDYLIKHKIDLKTYRVGYNTVQYLYMRSFYLNNDITEGCKTAFDYFKKQAALNWLDQNKYMQGMLALALQRYGNKTTPADIIQSLRENAIRSEEMGMYWKEVGSSYWWYEAPIETQSVLIEAFKEVALNEDEVDELKIWLLKNKQTQHWKTTKATADACYALLLNGSYWLSNQADVTITMGDQKISNVSLSGKESKSEAGTGYFKKSFSSEEIKSDMGNIQVKVASVGDAGKGVKSTSWGAVYWQYFENLDKITSAETPLKLKKDLFIERNSDKGPVLIPISDKDVINVGDKVTVRIELRVDREMEYVHMKDMRGACFEPINVLSNYKYQGGLGYYEATKDAATNFFFNWLNKGTYVFEYSMFATNKGNYSNGIASIQCMYAPEFSSHSDGVRVEVK